MERFVHQENLAHLRRLLAESKLRHNTLMRLLVEEEANELLMPVTATVR